MSPGLLGARVRRNHDPRLLTGHGAFVDDLRLPGQLHMAVWRSPVAHALVGRVRLEPALGLPGVVDAFDVNAFGPSPPVFATVVSHESLKSCPQFPLAKDRVRLFRHVFDLNTRHGAILALQAPDRDHPTFG